MNTKIFPDTKTLELRVILPVDQVELLRTVARRNGLRPADYARSLLMAHLNRIVPAETDGGKA
jgi:hypothetical protein